MDGTQIVVRVVSFGLKDRKIYNIQTQQRRLKKKKKTIAIVRFSAKKKKIKLRDKRYPFAKYRSKKDKKFANEYETSTTTSLPPCLAMCYARKIKNIYNLFTFVKTLENSIQGIQGKSFLTAI